METAAEMQLADERRAYRVVIGLPVFNGARHLARALESLLVQSFDEFILVVVDNCSTDATPEIVHRYAALDSRIVYERNPQTIGAGENFRRAFEAATERLGSFDYFCWASDHDVWHPSWLEALFAEFEADPRLVGAFPFWLPISADDDQRRPDRRKWDTTGLDDPLDRVRHVARGVPPRAGSVAYGLFRANALRRCGIYRSVIEPDYLLLAQLAVLGSLKQVPRVLWHRRFFGTKPTRKRQRNMLFTGTAPLHAFLPPPLVHSAVLFRWTVISGAGRPEAGRLRGVAIALAYLWLAVGERTQRILRRQRRAMRKRLKRGRSERRVWRKELRRARRRQIGRARRAGSNLARALPSPVRTKIGSRRRLARK